MILAMSGYCAVTTIVQGNIRWTNAKRWSLRSTRPIIEQYELKKDDVVLAMDRPWIDAGLNNAAIGDDDLPCLLLQRTSRLRGGPNLDISFLRYVIGSPEFTKHIQSITTGSLVPHISSRQIKDFAFKLPPLAAQKRIAAVLSALDAKIALNHRINGELEGMAKLLYDYWFVQYDFPLSAAQAAALGKPRLAGKPYRSSGGPMVFDPQLKREIPKGWSTAQIGSLVPIGKETVNPSNDPEQVFKLFSIPVYDRSGTYSLEKGSAIGSNKFVVAVTDLLVSKLNPWTSRVIYPPEEYPMICSTEFVVLQTGAAWMKNFLYMVTTNSHFIAFCSQSATGTSNSHKRVNPAF